MIGFAWPSAHITNILLVYDCGHFFAYFIIWLLDVIAIEYIRLLWQSVIEQNCAFSSGTRYQVLAKADSLSVRFGVGGRKMVSPGSLLFSFPARKERCTQQHLAILSPP